MSGGVSSSNGFCTMLKKTEGGGVKLTPPPARNRVNVKQLIIKNDNVKATSYFSAINN